MGQQDTPREPGKPYGGIYADITVQILLDCTIPGNENPLHCQMTQHIDMVSTQSCYILSA